MEFFRNPNIDFLSKKWYFIAFSLVFSVAGVLSMLFWHHVPLGVEFRGGTLVYVKFAGTPDDNRIRAALDRANLHRARIQRFGMAGASFSASTPYWGFMYCSPRDLDNLMNFVLDRLRYNRAA